jgi:hypothetical protein
MDSSQNGRNFLEKILPIAFHLELNFGQSLEPLCKIQSW